MASENERAGDFHAESTLELARRHVAIGERLVAEQQALLDRLRANGETVSSEAERLLVNLRNTLAMMRKHLASEQRKSEKE